MKTVIVILAIVVVLGLGIWNYILLKKLKALESSIVELRDSKPTSKRLTKTSNAMKLSNEIAPYIHEEGEEIIVKVLKW